MVIQCDWTGECTGYKEFCNICTRNVLADDDFSTDCFEEREEFL